MRNKNHPRQPVGHRGRGLVRLDCQRFRRLTQLHIAVLLGVCALLHSRSLRTSHGGVTEARLDDRGIAGRDDVVLIEVELSPCGRSILAEVRLDD